MPTTDQLRSKLINKLKELFQLNQPDLDFGFYRIMHAKSEQVSSFIENDLLQVIQDTFGQVDETKKDKLKQELDNAIQTAIDFGAPDPETTTKVIEARAKYEAIKDSASSEAEIYDHLYRFFERYYDDGDFISRRYYTRETPGKAAPFSIPYNGEEVKLHWANADQYYIKTTEYFANYAVNLTEAVKGLKETKKKSDEEIDLDDSSVPEGLKLHFRIIDATEGDHANVKASDATKRYFLIHKAKPVELNDKNELIINFEYRPDQAGAKQDALNKDALSAIIYALKLEPSMAAYYEHLSHRTPTDKDKDRILLTKYVNQYTARNTMDYFIHKNLGAFLKRELDFYIKNEIMRLDDIENAEVPKVEDYLSKIKVLRKIAIKLIEFMAQLEDFQKKLWLKKKFVVETNYCITIDRVPEALYPQIIANKEQIGEWIKLYAIDEIEADTTCPAFTNPPTLNFLKVNNKLMLDTRFFDDAFKARLISSIQDFDDKCDGLLIHSENFQALNLAQQRLLGQVTYIYIDPPYNTNEASFIYKNEYKHSSWGTMVFNSINKSKPLMSSNGLISIAIDDLEQPFLANICDELFGIEERLGTLVIEIKPSGRTNDNFLATSHEYILFYGYNSSETKICFFELTDDQKNQYFETDDSSAYKWRDFLRTGGYSTPEERPNSFYPIYYDEVTGKVTLEETEGYLKILPIDSEGKFRVWRKTPPSFLEHLNSGEINIKKSINGQWKVQIIDRIKQGTRPKSVWVGKKYDAASHGTKHLKQLFGNSAPFSFPKSVFAVSDCVYIVSGDSDLDHVILDYFAGSGTTGQAVINLNRNDGGNRKYILVEMGDYFDTVLKPRINKVVYSKDWKEGKPKDRDTGISHCFKYLRLESYEDTLNNLVLQNEPIRDITLADNASLQEDYILHYMLDVESKGSQSLLNIDAFNDPTSYALKVKKPGSDEYIEKAVDLIETFNYLIGLRLVHLGVPQTLTAASTRVPDPDLPQDQDTKLIINGDFKQVADGKWWIRKVEGWVPKNPYSPNDGLKEKVLIVWRKLTGNLEEDNLILDAWFQKNRISTLDWEFDTIYVNGSNNLPNLQQDGDTWKVRLIEEEFMKRMWEQN